MVRKQEQAKRSGASAPDLSRVRERHHPDQWGDSEMLTLPEAAALFWPAGPLTATSLRTAVRDRRLDIAEIAGKILTNKAAILKMCVCEPRGSSGPATAAEPKPVSRRRPSDRELLQMLGSD